MLYHLFLEHILKKEKLEYPYFEQFMFKYSIINRLIPFINRVNFESVSKYIR